MRLLLFLICFLFSAIFYVFSLLGSGKKIFGLNSFYIESLSGNLMIESVSFLILGIIFFIYFSPKMSFDSFFGKLEKNLKIFHIFFYVILFLYLFLVRNSYDEFILFGIIFFIFSDICFNFLSNLKYFKEQKISLRYFGLFLNYSSSFISIYYLFNIDFSFLLVLVLLFNINFNYCIHKKYNNYISLFSVYLTFILLLFLLFFRLYYLIKI